MANTDKVAEIRDFLSIESEAAWIANLWDTYDNQRQEVKKRWLETRNYVFATDTSTTANHKLPWTHKTTLPKLTQIRDNLHSNYISSLFPNDKWLSWVAYDKNAAKKEKAKTIRSYMENKTREGGFRDTISQLLLDYIDTGNCFAMPSFEARYRDLNGEKVAGFIGPKAVRISYNDIVFNPLAASFENTFKVVRSTKTLGELKKLAQTHPEHRFWEKAIERRLRIQENMGNFSKDDFEKAQAYSNDGFGNMWDYYRSEYMEILEFYGDFHTLEGELRTSRMITVVDRAMVVRDEPIPAYDGVPPIYHCGWRKRPDNLWAMGPLDNLVGMQYMIDHIQNMKANALDLMILSPKKIIGEVEEFEWGPLAEIHIDEGGDVQELAQNYSNIIAADQQIEILESKMELYAGAPREAMGIRTPGEKTAFEVQALENAAGRIFQEKVVQFELFMERLLNGMLESAHRNMDMGDMIRILDNDIGVQQFKEITKEDITANGILRPVGARHFAQKAQELQNLVGVFSSPIGPMIQPHTSGIALTKYIEDIVDLRGYEVFRPNVAIEELQETQALASQAEEDNLMERQAGMSEEELLATTPGMTNEDEAV